MVGVKKESEEEEDGELEQAQIKKAAICIEHTVRTVDQNLKGILCVDGCVQSAYVGVSVCISVPIATCARGLWL